MIGVKAPSQRRGDGSGALASRGLHLSPTLHRMADAIRAEEAAQRREERSNAKPKHRGIAPQLSDDQILEMRALHDFAGWHPKRLRERFGVDEGMVKRVPSGITRSRLVATREHLPAEVVGVMLAQFFIRLVGAFVLAGCGVPHVGHEPFGYRRPVSAYASWCRS